MKKFRGFTLAEVLITLAIIGVVAAIAVPSVISNSQQREFKTGLKKAVSVLNSAITMNMAIDGESPYDNLNLFDYLQRHMSVMKSTSKLPFYGVAYGLDGRKIAWGYNAAFYTTDGMRFEFEDYKSNCAGPKLHNSNVVACMAAYAYNADTYEVKGCGSYGLEANPNGTMSPPCVIMVDVNGDRKPTPANIDCQTASCQDTNKYVSKDPNTNKIGDIFTILITEDKAIPYGTVAQRAMYDAQK